MKNRKCLTAAIIAFVLLSNVCFGSASQGFQYWNSDDITFDINKDWQFTVSQEERLCNGGGNLYYEHTDFGFMRKNVTPWLDLGFNYRLIYEKNNADHMKPENYPYVDTILKTKFFGCDLSDRSRIAFRDRTNQDDLWQYRNKITLKFPVELTSWKLQPFISEELFFDLEQQGLYKSWFIPGFNFPVSKNLTCEISWLWQVRQAQPHWEDVTGIITRLKFHF